MKNGKIHIIIAVFGVFLVLAMLVVPIGVASAEINLAHRAYENICANADFTDWTYEPYTQVGWPVDQYGGSLAWEVNQTLFGWSFGASNSTPSKVPQFTTAVNQSGVALPYKYNYGFYMQQYVDVEAGQTYNIGLFGCKVEYVYSGTDIIGTTVVATDWIGSITVSATNGLSNTNNFDNGNLIARIRTQNGNKYRLEVGTYYRTNQTTDNFYLLQGVVLCDPNYQPIWVPNSYSNYGYDQGINSYDVAIQNERRMEVAYAEGRGYNRGYSAGYDEGLSTAEHGDFKSLITAVIDVPFNAIVGLFDFDLLGYNMAGVLGTLIVVAIGLIIIKRFL